MSDTDMNQYWYIWSWDEKIMANLYCDVPHDVVSYRWPICLAASHHRAEKHIACGCASMQFDDIINHSRGETCYLLFRETQKFEK